MASPLSRGSKLRAQRDPNGDLWDYTLLPRILETMALHKLAQVRNVTDNAPATPDPNAAARDLYREHGSGIRTIAEHMVNNPSAFKPVASRWAAGDRKGVVDESLNVIKGNSTLRGQLTKQYAGLVGGTLLNTAANRLPAPLRNGLIDWYARPKIEANLPATVGVPQATPGQAWAQPLHTSGLEYGLNNLDALKSVPNAAAKLTAGGIAGATGTPLNQIAQRYSKDIDPHVEQFMQQNPQAITQAARNYATQNGGLARKGLAVADAFGQGDRAALWAGTWYNRQGYEAWKAGKPIAEAVPGQAPSSGMQKLMSALNFKFDPSKGYLGSFLNGQGNSGHRWAAGGMSLMALLWLLSRMGKR